jgi:hypothetical protein
VEGSLWFDLAPWLAFGATLISFFVWPRRSPRPSRRRRAMRLLPGQRPKPPTPPSPGGQDSGRETESQRPEPQRHEPECHEQQRHELERHKTTPP